MNLNYTIPEFIILRDPQKCNNCGLCVKNCSFGAHYYSKHNKVESDNTKCVNCHYCVVRCPKRALVIKKHPLEFRYNSYWTESVIKDIYKQAATGGILLTGMGTDREYPIYWDKILLNASQVTNPSIDPLREPMELRTFLGAKPGKLELDKANNPSELMPPQLELQIPVIFAGMSFGSISYNAFKALAMAAREAGIYFNTGEGGLHKDFYEFASHAIVQVASGRFGVNQEYLENSAAVEIKIGQGAKPGIGGHLPGKKVGEEVSKTRMIPLGSDAISPAPHHDIYSIEDLRQLIFAIKEATEYKKPVLVKIAAVHNAAAIASGIVRAGADIIVIDGFRAGTGAAPTRIRDNVGIPIELAIASVDERLKEEGIRKHVSIIASGGIRNSSDVVKAIALGADAVAIATAALIAIGCHMCQKCYTGKCNWGITTQDPELTKRLDPDKAAQRLLNLLRAWSLEIKEMLGGMGINAIESLKGNRLMLRGVGLSETELKILGISHAGQ